MSVTVVGVSMVQSYLLWIATEQNARTVAHKEEANSPLKFLLRRHCQNAGYSAEHWLQYLPVS